MCAAILRSGILLAMAALGTSAATAQTELFFATGVDSTGWAQAQSNADGHVLIESPQYPLGLWLHLVDEAGQALAGLLVEYQGQPDSLVAIRCVDPARGVQETLVSTRADGTLLRLILKPKEAADLPAGLVSIDWRIDTSAESLLEPVGTRLIGWEAVAAFLQERWQDQAGRVAVQFDTSTLAVGVDHPENIETLVAHLKQVHRPAGTSLEEKTALYVLEEKTVLYVQVFRGGLASLQEGVILYFPLFADANLESLVRRILGRPRGRLTPEDVASLTRLASKDIHSLAGIEHLTILQRLDLNYNQIADLTPLASLNNLTSLHLGRNQIVDLTPLASLNNLTDLSLWQNQIADLTPLASLNNLTSLHLNGNQIADLTPLASLENLTSLRLGWNQIADLTPLTHLNNLESLALDNNRIADLTPLVFLKNLTSLRLGWNQIADLTPLTHLNNLESLALNHNRIADLILLAQLNSLTYLSLSGNQISDLNPLADLTNLERLVLTTNQINDLTPLASLNNLEWLLLATNQISDLTPLAQLNNLTHLGLRRNQISDLIPLADLNNLIYLELDHNRIADLTPLAQLNNLERLRLYTNQISDLKPLADLNSLTFLDLATNQISDLASLTGLDNLKTLYLQENQIENIKPLVANTGIGEDDAIYLHGNPLSDQARNKHIPALKARGVAIILRAVSSRGYPAKLNAEAHHSPPPSLFSERTPP